MITPVIFYNLVTQIAQAFQEFNGPYIITQGGPRNATTLVSLLVYNYAFKSNECTGLGHVHRRCSADCDRFHQPEALGLLR